MHADELVRVDVTNARTSDRLHLVDPGAELHRFAALISSSIAATSCRYGRRFGMIAPHGLEPRRKLITTRNDGRMRPPRDAPARPARAPPVLRAQPLLRAATLLAKLGVGDRAPRGCNQRRRRRRIQGLRGRLRQFLPVSASARSTSAGAPRDQPAQALRCKTATMRASRSGAELTGAARRRRCHASFVRARQQPRPVADRPVAEGRRAPVRHHAGSEVSKRGAPQPRK